MLTICIVIFASLTSAKAQAQSARSNIRAEVWQRLLDRLETIPTRWDSLPPSSVPQSGRSLEVVLNAASDKEMSVAQALLSSLIKVRPELRRALIIRAQRRRDLSEVDLWLPLSIADHFRTQNINQACILYEIGLEIALLTGRRDILLTTAGLTFRLTTFRIPPDKVIKTVERWKKLNYNPSEYGGAAVLTANYAEILFHNGFTSKAFGALREARNLFRASGNRLELGRTWLSAGRLHHRIGDNDRAMKAYRMARNVFTSINAKDDIGNTRFSEADLFYQTGRTKHSLRYYRKARSIYIATKNNSGIGSTWIGESAILFRLGKINNALRACRRARPLFQVSGNIPGEGSSWRCEGDALLMHGDYLNSLKSYRTARSLAIAVDDKIGEGSSWIGEARILAYLRDHQNALKAYRQARALFRLTESKRGQGYSFDGEGDVYILLGEYTKALEAYRKSYSIYETTESPDGQGKAMVGHADVYFQLGDYTKARDTYLIARTFYLRADDKVGQCYTWLRESESLLYLGDFSHALHAASRATQIAKDVGIVPNEIVALSLKARILFSTNREAQAIKNARRALSLLISWRRKGVSDIDGTVYSDWSMPYDLLVPTLAQKGSKQLEEAFLLAEKAHAPVLLDLMLVHRRDHENDVTPRVFEESKHLQQQRMALETELQKVITPSKRRILRSRIESIEKEIDYKNIFVLDTPTSILLTGMHISAPTRNELAHTAGAILLYYVARDVTTAFLLRPEHRFPLVRHLALSREQLQHEVRQLRHDLANPVRETRAQARQQALYTQLLKPFARQLINTNRFTIIPHGPLHELPFDALLVDDDTPLFERFHLTQAPSLSTLYTLRQRRDRRKADSKQLELVGIADGTGLAFSEPTVEGVAELFPNGKNRLPTGPGTYDAYVEHAPHAKHLLLTTHGVHVANSRSGHLELTAAEGYPTRLTASEIALHPLRAELVTLAACETARAEAMLSDERLDLTRAFLIAGADAVLATRWSVPATDATRQFVVDFYEALRRGGPDGAPMRKDEALTEARRRSRARGDDAQLWAAWVLIGDAR